MKAVSEEGGIVAAPCASRVSAPLVSLCRMLDTLDTLDTIHWALEWTDSSLLHYWGLLGQSYPVPKKEALNAHVDHHLTVCPSSTDF